LIDNHCGRSDRINGVAGIQEINLQGKAASCGNIVRIHPGDQWGGSNAQTLVQRGDKPLVVGMPDETDAPVTKRGNDLRGSVGGSVINHQQFEIPECLSKDASDRVPDESGGIECRHQDGDRG
jgi:hypothetical protein